MRSRCFALCFLALLHSSCSDERTVGPPGEGEVGAACTLDADCDTGWCLREKTFKDNYCSLDCASQACPDGSSCHDYAGFKFCLSSCSGDGDCRKDYFCDYGVCVPPCTADKFCKAGDACFSGRCKAKCTSNDECSDGMRCQDGRCVPPCKSDGDCLPGFACDAASGTCKAKPGKPIGQACGSDGECSTGYCLPDRRICSAKCSSTTKCPSPYACGLETFDKDLNGTKESAVAVCVPDKGPKIAGEHCGNDADCASAHCYNGFCMEGCSQDGDCVGTALQCVTVKILLKGGVPNYNGCLPRTGSATFSLGTHTDYNTYLGVDVPPTASSFILSTEVSSTSEAGVVAQLTDPDGQILLQPSHGIDPCDSFAQPVRYDYDVQYSSLFVPNTPSVKLVPGIYTYALFASQLPVTVKIRTKLGTAQKGTLNLNWYFLNLSNLNCIPGATLNAASAPSHPWLNKIRNNLVTILTTAGLSLGQETFQDLQNPALDVIDLPDNGPSIEPQQLFASSKGQQGDSLNVFFVRNIKGDAGGIILGLAGGIPGPAGVHGTVHSGLMMSMQTGCFEIYGINPASVLAHEVGHYLGLSHNMENTLPGLLNGKIYCSCPCKANMSCVTPAGGGSYCRGMDTIPDTDNSDSNLMYWAAENTQIFKGNKLTPGQIRVMLNNPVVGH